MNKETISDIDLCIQVAIATGHEVVSDGISKNLVRCDLGMGRGIIPVNPDGKYLTIFDPVNNDTLCFNLIQKHNIVRVWESYDQMGWYYTDLENYLSKECKREAFLVSEYGENRAALLAIHEFTKSQRGNNDNC